MLKELSCLEDRHIRNILDLKELMKAEPGQQTPGLVQSAIRTLGHDFYSAAGETWKTAHAFPVNKLQLSEDLAWTSSLVKAISTRVQQNFPPKGHLHAS